MSLTNSQFLSTSTPLNFGRGGYNKDGDSTDDDSNNSHMLAFGRGGYNGPCTNQGRGGYNRGPSDDEEEDGRGGYN